MGESKPKRKLRPAQTLREKAEAANTPKKPKKRSFLGKFFAFIGIPFKATFKFLGKYKVFRIIGNILVPKYFRTSWAEIRLVKWPNRRETRRLTMAVIGFAVVFGALVATLDYGLGKLFKIIILGNHK